MLIQTKTDFERSILEQFKDRVKDLKQDDITLIRFLTAREYNMDHAEAMLRQCLNWRQKHDIENIFQWNEPRFLREDINYKITGYDYQGGPIIVLPLGSWTYRTWIEQGYGDDIEKWGYRIIEDGLQSIKASKNGNCQSVLIFDLKGLTYYQTAHLPSLKLIYTILKALEQNYPEVLKYLLVINAPWIFNIPYNFVKSIMHPRTMEKLKVFDSNKRNWLNFLTEIAPRKSLPDEYFQDENGN